MIKTLAPLGATHTISVLLDYAETVTATVVLTPKTEKDAQPLTFQLAGPLDELDAGFAAQLTEAVSKITSTTTELSALDAQLAAAKKAKEEELAAAKSKTTVKQSVAAAKPSKSKPVKKDEEEGDEDEEEKPETPAAPAASATAGAPSPAWKQKQALTPAPTPPPAAAGEPATLELGDI